VRSEAVGGLGLVSAMPPHLTATSDELATLASTAFEIIEELEWVRFDPPDAEDDEAGAVASARAAMAALLYCVVAAVPLADPELVPLVVDCLQVLHDDDDIDSRSADDAAIALLSKIGRATEAVRELAGGADERDRYVVASGLRPVGKDEIALLRELAQDTSIPVRRAARTALAPIGGVPWWCAWFALDPREHPAARDSAAVRAAISIVERLDADEGDSPVRWKRLARAVRALPDVLAIDLATHALRHAPRFGMRAAAAPVGTALLERAGGVDAYLAIIAQWRDLSEAIFPEASTGMVKGLREPRRGEVCLALARFALAASSDDDDRAEAAQLAASVAGQCWPATTDPAPLLDDILALGAHVPGSTRERVVSDLGGAFGKVPVVDGALLTRAVGLRLLGYPRGTTSIARALDAFVLRAPAAIARDVAERAIVTDHRETIVFGLEHLYGRGYDRRRDPPRRSLLRRWLASPTFRSAVLESHSLTSVAAALLRGDLVRGALTFADAVRVMWSLAWSGGGSAAIDSVLSPTRFGKSDVFDRRWTPTSEEWRAYRALRAQRVSAESFDRHRAAAVVPPGPWEPSDRAFIERMIAEAAGHPESIWGLAQTVAAKATPPDRELFARLEMLSGEEEDVHDLAPLRREMEARLRAKSRRIRADTAGKLRVVRGGRA
jgi:hypothetical protein